VLATNPDGSGDVQPLASFMTNPAGSAIVNATGAIRQVVEAGAAGGQHWLAIRDGATDTSAIVQRQLP
jgi:hypothetical protein